MALGLDSERQAALLQRLGCKAFTGLTRQPVQLRLRAVVSRIKL
jgi:hypothetical protein